MEFYTGKSEEDDAKYLLSYINDVLIPASEEFFVLVNQNKVLLHHAFSFNTILSHAIDYMIFIAKKVTKSSSNSSVIRRNDFISKFDKKYHVDGCSHINNKFKLLDAVNNSFKHVELEQKRYADLIKVYGDLNFHNLFAEDGKVFFKSQLYSFDYCRVVMRPIAKIFDCDINTYNDVDDFINGRIHGSFGYGNFPYEYEPYDAIDRMIDFCNSECKNCGEVDDDCDCVNYIYGQKLGKCSPNIDPSFDFNDVMSDISGAREWRKK
ncbi:MAG: hypothetical protein ACTH7W_05255 [Psychrobacter sp.]|uniref:hypothetical protein n=2 Tax=Moraxellaceae TaxID=468 RepID=UPI0017888861|nr:MULTISPECIES: hypothetical protein [unclassified Psychrobacter]MBE0443303.1 hypothetical protein [Psychrobacter sp. FME13]